MLKFERRQIAANIAEGVRPYVMAFVRRYGALPDRFWQDEYVLGFIPALTGLFARAVTGDKLNEIDALAIVRECLNDISGDFGATIMSQVDGLTLTQPQDFVAGARAAGKVMAFSTGQLPAADSDLKRACETAGVSPAAARARENFSAVATALVTLLFYEVVDRRLMAGVELPETGGDDNGALDAEVEADGSVKIRF